MRALGLILVLFLVVGCTDTPSSQLGTFEQAEPGTNQPHYSPTPAPMTPPPEIRTAFDEFILETYPNLREYNGLLQIDDEIVIKVPEELKRHYFSSEDETIKEKAQEWGSGKKTVEGSIVNMVNWARAKTTYDFVKAESDDIYYQSASETLETGMGICGDQARLMASLLYNGGYKNVTLVSARCTGGMINGPHGFVVLYHDGEEYYIDLTNDYWLPFDKDTPKFYKIVCEDVFQVMTPTMLVSDYLN